MYNLINEEIRKIKPSPIREMSNKAALYPNVINLSVGQPDFFTPNHVKTAAKDAIDNNLTGYTSNAGILELREAASNFFDLKYNVKYDPETEVIVTNGATQALDITFRTILQEGCEVILPAPVYVGYEPLIRLCGAIPIHVDTSSNDFVITAEMIKKHLTSKTRCIVLASPSNPTGSIIDEHELKNIAELIKDYNIFILSDEIYSELTYYNKHTSIASYECIKEKVIVINGLSKSHSMTGWRIGFIFSPQYLSNEILKAQQFSLTCASSISQYAGLEALTVGINDADNMKKEYIKRLDFVYNELVSMGLEVVKPKGAFYIFPSIKKFNISSQEFAEMLIEKEQVAVVPGNAFSSYGEGYIRISYAASMEELEEAMKRMRRFIKELERKVIRK